MFLQRTFIYQAILLLLILATPLAPPQLTSLAFAAAADGNGGEAVEVEKIKEKYWDRGNEAEIGVVQNRIFSKRKKFELGVFGSNINGDPFLSIYTVGGSVGYHFTEYFSVHFYAWDAIVSPSSALSTLQNQLNTTTNTNQPTFFYGLEARGSLLYGKLSLIGAMILYFDAYVTAGGGLIGTQSGNDGAMLAGIGSQVHVNQLFSLNLDYRIIGYNETIIGKVTSGSNANYGQNLGNRTNVSGIVTLGVSFLLNFFGN